MKVAVPWFPLGALAAGLACVCPAMPQSAATDDPAAVRALVDEGALPRARLAEVDEEIADIRDEDILQRLLYGTIGIEELTEQQAEEVVAAAAHRVERQKARLTHRQTLVDEGALPKNSLAPFVEELESRERTLDIAKARAGLIRELAEIARLEKVALAPPGEYAGFVPVYERFDGAGVLRTADLRAIQQAYEKQFARPLPVSARGATALHRALGFDHSGRIDVAVEPDTPEGVWLRTFLKSLRIPFYAFRSALPGRSTGAHIHIGPPSERIGRGG